MHRSPHRLPEPSRQSHFLTLQAHYTIRLREEAFRTSYGKRKDTQKSPQRRLLLGLVMMCSFLYPQINFRKPHVSCISSPCPISLSLQEPSDKFYEGIVYFRRDASPAVYSAFVAFHPVSSTAAVKTTTLTLPGLYAWIYFVVKRPL